VRIQRHGKSVFRHSLMAGVVIGANLILVPLAAFGLAQPGSGNVIGAILISAVLWGIWLVGWWSKVTVTRAGVTLDNVCVRRFIPWDDLASIGYQGGLSFTLNDGTRLGTLCYGGSLAGSITGYRGCGAPATTYSPPATGSARVPRVPRVTVSRMATSGAGAWSSCGGPA
jgi:hypothetical protein